MTFEEILPHVDHTLLAATATKGEIEKLCEEAEMYHTASVCVPSSFVKEIRERHPGLRICAVAGFPLGNMSKAAKVFESRQAVLDGADEIDIVLHIGALECGVRHGRNRGGQRGDRGSCAEGHHRDLPFDGRGEDPCVRMRHKGRGGLYQDIDRVLDKRRGSLGYCAFQKAHWKECEDQSGRRNPYEEGNGRLPCCRMRPDRRQRRGEGVLEGKRNVGKGKKKRKIEREKPK